MWQSSIPFEAQEIMSKRLSELKEEAKRIRTEQGCEAHLDRLLNVWKANLLSVCEEDRAVKKAWSLSFISINNIHYGSVSTSVWPFGHPSRNVEWRARAWEKGEKNVTYICSANTAEELYPPGTIEKQLALFGLGFVIHPTVLYLPKDPEKLFNRKFLPYIYGAFYFAMYPFSVKACMEDLPCIEGIDKPDLNNEEYVEELYSRRCGSDFKKKFEIAQKKLQEELEHIEYSYEVSKEDVLQKTKTLTSAIFKRLGQGSDPLTKE